MRALVAFVIAIATLTVCVSAQSAPNLAGTWKLDPAQGAAVGGGTGARAGEGGGRGGGLGLGPAPDQLVIEQETVLVKINERRGTDSASVVLVLDGSAQTRAFAAGRSAGASAKTVTTIKNGRLVTVVTLPAAPAGGAAVQYEETRYLSAEGALVIDITMAGSTNSRHTVYTKVR